jgi:tetraacyldisaccharide 4'-kinase
MSLLQYILFPLGLTWGIVAQIKRTLYERLTLRHHGALPNIVVGNIGVGGSGKTPTLLWIHKQLESLGVQTHKIGLLSRGYKRKSKGFLWVQSIDDSHLVGDEPTELFLALNNDSSTTNTQKIAVCENRIVGLLEMKNQSPELTCVLLDDGYQHLRLKADLNILVCDYHHPFTQDFPMPSGKLREFPWATKNADCIIITNCPESLTQENAEQFKLKLISQTNLWLKFLNPVAFKAKLKWANQVVFLTTRQEKQPNFYTEGKYDPEAPVLLITGIANPSRVINSLNGQTVTKHLNYPDHHAYTLSDVQEIQNTYHNLKSQSPKLTCITTRKDWVKLKALWGTNIEISVVSSKMQPIFHSHDAFQHLLKSFIHEKRIV